MTISMPMLISLSTALVLAAMVLHSCGGPQAQPEDPKKKYYKELSQDVEGYKKKWGISDDDYQ